MWAICLSFEGFYSRLFSFSKAMRLRPLEDLLEYELAKVAKSIFEACEVVPEATAALLTARDRRKRTVLHLAAMQGNMRLARLFLGAVEEADRRFFAAALDTGGQFITQHHCQCSTCRFYPASTCTFVVLSSSLTRSPRAQVPDVQKSVQG